MTADPPIAHFVDRVRHCLHARASFAHMRARAHGQHILIEPDLSRPSRDRDAVARLTVLGHEAFGLSFRRAGGGWDPIVIIDGLEEIVEDFVAQSCET